MHKSADQMIIMIEQCDGLMNQQAPHNNQDLD